MKRTTLIAAIAATLFSATALAHGGPGMQGMGSGQGKGPGMMQGGGHGMMHGGGPGMGKGMGGMGMGGGACMGAESMGALNLSAEQRDKIATIQKELSTKQFALMASMRDLRTQVFQAGKPVDSKTYDAMAAVRKQMFELTREGREQVEAVLTPEQRAQWRPGWRGAAGRGAPWRG